MAIDPDALSELFERLGPVSSRRMFGGSGVYHGGVMFALESDGVLYLKTSPATEDDFRAEGSEPFSYEMKRGRRTMTSYWRIPERLLDEPDELAEWARAAVGVANAKAAALAKRKTSPKRRSGRGSAGVRRPGR